MRTAFYVVILSILIGFAGSCAKPTDTNESAIDIAERAFNEQRYAKAQNIADSIMLGSSFATLDVSELCRLSLLFTRLGERSSDTEANMAMATRALDAAYNLDSDSTAAYIRSVPFDDRAQMAIISALTKAHNDGDSIILEPDTLI